MVPGFLPHLGFEFISGLEPEHGLLREREWHYAGHDGSLSNIYDFSGPVAKLKKQNRNFAKFTTKAKETRKDVSPRGHNPTEAKVKKAA